MIKAKYTGYESDKLEAGKVYKITTHCGGNRLNVICKGEKFSYRNLEQMLKEWRVVAVYHA